MRVQPQDFLLALLLAGLTFAVFAPVGDYPFIRLDDYGYVVQNARVQQGPTVESLAWAWSAFEMANWHPLTWWSHMLDVRLFGDDAGGHHLTNVALHAANAVLVFALLFHLTAARWRSLIVATLFALHPLHVETVAWIAERKDVLSTLFGLLAVAAWTSWVRRAGALRYTAALASFAASLASKPMLVTLPLVLLLLDYAVFERFPQRTRRALVEKLPLLALSAGSILITLAAQRGAMSDVSVIPVSMRVGNAAVSYWRYIAKTIWPTDLSVFYTYPSLEGGGWPGWQVGIAVAGLLAATALAWCSRRRWAIAAWLFYLGTLVPVIGLVQVGRQAMADRYTYIPSLGLFVLFAWAGATLVAKLGDSRGPRAAAAVACVLVLAGCAAGTRRQLGYWRDSVTLFEHGLEISPRALTLHNNLGIEFATRRDWDAAERHFESATRIAPDGPEAYYNLGRLLAGRGRVDEAIANLSRAVALAPAHGESRFQLAILLRQTGRAGEAIPHFREAARLQPDSVAALSQASWLLATWFEESKRDPVEALRLAQRAVGLRRDAATLDALAAALAANGDFERAAATAGEALRIAAASGNERKAAALRQRIAAYRQRQPHVTSR